MRTHYAITVGLLLCGSALAQGPLTPPGAPGETMKTLAQVEPRTPIPALPFTISTPGSYYVTTNLTVASGDGITIGASEVTLDLMGFALQGGGSGFGVYVNAAVTNVSVGNGTLLRWNTGVLAIQCNRGRFERITSSQCGADGFTIGADNLLRDCAALSCDDDGFDARGDRNVFERCRAVGCAYSGFYMLYKKEGVLRGCEAYDSTVSSGGGIMVGDQFTVEDCTVSGNAGDGLQGGSRCIIRGNTSRSNGFASGSGFNVHLTGTSNEVVDNVSVDGRVGLQADGAYNRVAGNTVRGNTYNYSFAAGNQLELVISELPVSLDWSASVKLAGTLTMSTTQDSGITVNADNVTIDMGGHSLVGPGAESGSGIYQADSRHNLRVYNGKVSNWQGTGAAGINANGHGGQLDHIQALNNVVGIRAGPGSAIRDCTAAYSQGTGIIVSDGSSVSGCTANDNSAGIIASSECVILNNVCRDQFINLGSGFFSGVGIRVYLSNSRIEGNTLVGNWKGLLVDDAENLIVRNCASANTFDYDIAGGNSVGTIQSTPVGAGAWDNLSY